jgi:2'-5' RNA ligase
VEDERVEPLRLSLAGAVAGTPNLSFGLTELGGFPSLAKARVLWAGLDSEAALELLVHRVVQACAVLGFPVEGRPYRPHVTLGRLREGNRLSPEAIQEIESVRLDPVSFMSQQVILYQSLTDAGGSRYEARATFPLGN